VPSRTGSSIGTRPSPREHDTTVEAQRRGEGLDERLREETHAAAAAANAAASVKEMPPRR